MTGLTKFRSTVGCHNPLGVIPKLSKLRKFQRSFRPPKSGPNINLAVWNFYMLWKVTPVSLGNFVKLETSRDRFCFRFSVKFQGVISP